jgi:hypothetical protein
MQYIYWKKLMTNPSFQDVTDRLLLALGLKKETDLGAALGFTQSAWSVRKMRKSLPTGEIEALLKKERISPEYIYNGTGNVYEMDDWAGEYKLRTAELRLAKLPLTREMGYKEEVIDALINMDEKSKFKANAYTFITALRDAFKMTELDITRLITGVDLQLLPNSSAQIASSEEQAVLDAYRKASRQGKQFIYQAAGMVATPAAASKPSNRSIKIDGAVSGGTVNTGKITKGR